MVRRALLIGVLGAIGCFAQVSPVFYPSGAHVNLYFPHLADGGLTATGQWQTALEFVNPSPTLTAHVQVNLFGDLGFPLNLNFDTGVGAQAIHTFTIAPQGRFTLRSTIASATLVTGRATAVSDVPITGTVLFRYILNSSVFVEVSAPPALPTPRYLSVANSALGIALANTSGVAKFYQIEARNNAGSIVGTKAVSVAGLGHKSFNLRDELTSLPANFTGSIVITPQDAGDQVLAWTLNSDTISPTTIPIGIISTLPPGPQEWPISHADRIQLVFMRLLAAGPSVPGSNLSLQSLPNLVISTTAGVNATASSNQTVTINLALSELVSDSPSELAFLVAHELAHIAQFRSGANTVLLANSLANKEADADLVAMILVLSAGFDPYGAAGAIGKLNMAFQSSGLVSPFFDGLTDPTSAFNTTRMNSLLGLITTACANYVAGGYCTSFKGSVHPHFSAQAPL